MENLNTAHQGAKVPTENWCSRIKWMVVCLPFAFLWYRVFDSVHLEWSTNPQYSFGWIVPFLCLGLLLRNGSTPCANSSIPPVRHGFSDGEPVRPSFGEGGPVRRSFSEGGYFLFFLFGLFLFLPARLLAAATPEWRPLQWMMALIAVGSTLFLVRSLWGRSGLAKFGFPILFFLVAIPWPTPIEQPIIQSLTRVNASVVVELMGVLGIPAIQHGNLIEVGSGVVGIDEACSGIRSFQSSIMISLFLGEFYRVTWLRRFVLFVLGIVLSFLFNVCRTSFLTWIASKKGVAAIAQYHDPAGLAILVACTVTLMVVGMGMGKKQKFGKQEAEMEGQKSEVRDQGAEGGGPVRHSLGDGGSFSAFQHFPLRVAVGLIVWLAIVEIGTTLWFSIRESKFASGPDWKMAFPVNDSSFKSVTIDEKTYGLLRFDDGLQGEWQDKDGATWHGFYFNWVPGRVAGYLAKRHTPEICMGAAGQGLRAGPDLFVAKVHNVTLPIRQYLYGEPGAPMHVFHCRWEVGADETAFTQHESSRLNLIRGIWAGRGKNGQKVIEIIVTGIDSPAEAKAALIRQLETLIQVDPKSVAQK